MEEYELYHRLRKDLSEKLSTDIKNSTFEYESKIETLSQELKASKKQFDEYKRNIYAGVCTIIMALLSSGAFSVYSLSNSINAIGDSVIIKEAQGYRNEIKDVYEDITLYTNKIKKGVADEIINNRPAFDGLVENVSKNESFTKSIVGKVVKDKEFKNYLNNIVMASLVTDDEFFNAAVKSTVACLVSGENSETLASQVSSGIVGNSSAMDDISSEIFNSKDHDSQTLRDNLYPKVSQELANKLSFQKDLASLIKISLQNDDEFKDLLVTRISNQVSTFGGVYKQGLFTCKVPNFYTKGCSCPPGYESSKVTEFSRYENSQAWNSVGAVDLWVCYNALIH